MPPDDYPTPTQQVMARLYGEGWVDCPQVGFPALSQVPIPDIRRFVLAQLHRQEGWMWKRDLELASLIFSIPDHEFQVHPQLEKTLNQLSQETLIQLESIQYPVPREHQIEVVVSLLALPSRTLQEAVGY